MEPFFDFLGNYWWLVFPIAGMASGLGGWWSKQSKQRHNRRLELIKARAEAKALRSGYVAPTAVPAGAGAPAATPRETDATQLQRLMATHDGVTHRWLDYELDVAKLIAFPAMSDGRQPLTAAFLRAKKVADGLRPASVNDKVASQHFADYRDAVHDYEVAFDIAEQDARRLRDSTFTDAERKRLDRAQHMLQVAVDESATAAERQVAYRRVREELDGLISISDEAIQVLEKKVGHELTTGHPRATPGRDAAGRGLPRQDADQGEPATTARTEPAAAREAAAVPEDPTRRDRLPPT